MYTFNESYRVVYLFTSYGYVIIVVNLSTIFVVVSPGTVVTSSLLRLCQGRESLESEVVLLRP